MKGFVPTPPDVVDYMVARLFAERPPSPDELLLDPGCGEGPFVEGVLRWCRRNGVAPPRILGIELHPGRAAEARRRFRREPAVEIVEGDFLNAAWPAVDYVIGNPPYVPITQLSETEKALYRNRFRTASGRFDLYLLFFEQGMRAMKEGGRLVFVTPEKYLSNGTARPLRQLLAQRDVPEIVLIPEGTFAGLVTYPAVTVVDGRPPRRPTRVTLRDGSSRCLRFDAGGASVAAALYGDALHGEACSGGTTLDAVTRRISCGVATGADRVFVHAAEHIADALRPFAFPTVSGRQLGSGDLLAVRDVMLVPYDEGGTLLPPARLGALGDYLSDPAQERALRRRTCVRKKPWYAFHETPPMGDLLRPKLLCKDIAQAPRFWIDWTGQIIPRHSVYYVTPERVEDLHPLSVWLNGEKVADWLMAHAQPAANGYRRLQSTVLKSIPIPAELAAQLARPESLIGTAWRVPHAPSVSAH